MTTLGLKRADALPPATVYVRDVACQDPTGFDDPHGLFGSGCGAKPGEPCGENGTGYHQLRWSMAHVVDRLLDGRPADYGDRRDIPEGRRLAPGTRCTIESHYPGDVADGRKGGSYVIESYVSPEEGSDGDWYPAAYMVEDRDGMMFGGMVPHHALVVTHTPAEHAAANRLPTVGEVAAFLAERLLGDDGTIETNETSPLTKVPQKDAPPWPEAHHDYTHGAEVYGRLVDGRRFGFAVRITGLWEIDG